MLFNEALKEMKDGKYVVREKWAVGEGYIVLMPRMTMLWKMLSIPQPNAGVWMASVEDLEADDWKLLDKEEVVVASVPTVETPAAA